MKKKEEQLVRKVTDMIQKTREGKLHWDIQCQTTEYNDPAKKPVETEEGETWVIDECFVSYHCMDQEKEFLLVSYEQIYTCGEKKKSCNLIFLPPLGIQFHALWIFFILLKHGQPQHMYFVDQHLIRLHCIRS